MKKFLFSLFPLLIVLCLSLPIIRPLFSPGFFPMHDDTQVARVFEMGKALQDGMFPVRWVKDLGYGYGYPIFTFYAPFAYYIGGVIVSVGTDPLIATKIMMGIGMLLSGVFMYLLGKEAWGKSGGIISALFYSFATYHAVDLYVRGDVAELFAYAFIPLAAYGILAAYKRKSIIQVFVGSLGFAGIVISHNLTAFIAAPFLCIFAVLLAIRLWKTKTSRKFTLVPFAPLVGGAFLSTFYWLPVFTEMRYTNVLSQVGGGADFRNHFVCLSQLWYSQWGYGGSVAGCTDGLSFMVGKMHILAVVIGVPLFIFFFKKRREYSWWILGGIIGFILSVFLMTSFSRALWESFSFMAFLQYPWRYLLLASFFSSFLAGASMVLVRGRMLRFALVAVIVTVLLLLQSKFFVPQKTLAVSSSDYVSPVILTWKASKISDEYLPKDFVKPMSPADLPVTSFTAYHAQKGVLLVVEDKTQQKEAIVDSQTPAQVQAYIADFPAWKLFVDGVETSYSLGKNGLSVTVPPGRHTVSARYISPLPETVGNIVTLTSIAVFVLGIIYERSKRSYGKKTS